MTFSGNFWHWKLIPLHRSPCRPATGGGIDGCCKHQEISSLFFLFLFNTAANVQASASRKRGLTLYLLEWVEQVSLARLREPSNSWPTSPYSKKIKLYIGHDEWSCFSMFYIWWLRASVYLEFQCAALTLSPVSADICRVDSGRNCFIQWIFFRREYLNMR